MKRVRARFEESSASQYSIIEQNKIPKPSIPPRIGSRQKQMVNKSQVRILDSIASNRKDDSIEEPNLDNDFSDSEITEVEADQSSVEREPRFKQVVERLLEDQRKR